MGSRFFIAFRPLFCRTLAARYHGRFPATQCPSKPCAYNRASSVYREIASGYGLNARGLTDGPTGLNRCRSAKMCCSLNSGYPLTFRLNSRDSAALPLSVTCTSRYPGARVIHPFCRNSVISAEPASPPR
jgi:hypothetical protein